MTTQRRRSINLWRVPRGRSSQSRRTGALTIFVLLLLVIAILMMMLVINWIWLVLNNRDMQRRGDVLALTAASELLDEQLLKDEPSFQLDDVHDARAVTDRFRIANNLVSARAMRLDSTNLRVTPGHIANVHDPVFQAREPYNSLRLELFKYATGLNRVQMLIQGFGSPDEADVSTASIATLDSHLVGFRPLDVATPLVPIAIQTDAWFVHRPATGTDSNSNDLRELDAVLKSSSGSGKSNAAIIDFDETIPIEFAVIPDQVLDGVRSSDLAATEFGPATPSSPITVPATQLSPSNTRIIVEALRTIAGESDPRRIFPLYSVPFGDPLRIVGFVAAAVLDAADTGGTSHRLKLRIEPTFIAHFTAVTDPLVPENIYIHKLRLVK